MGRGRVILCTTTGNLQWTFWPYAGGMFVPLVQLSLVWLAQGAPEGANRTAGETLFWTPPVADENKPHDLRTPDGEDIRLGRPQMRGGQPFFEIKDTARAGIYALAPSARAAEGVGVANPEGRDRAAGTLFAVNPDLAESDNLDGLSDDALNELLGKDNLYHWTAGKPGEAIGDERDRGRWPLTPWLLGGLAVLFVAELFMAWVCSREQAGGSPVWTAVLLVLIVLVVVQQIVLLLGALALLVRPNLL